MAPVLPDQTRRWKCASGTVEWKAGRWGEEVVGAQKPRVVHWSEGRGCRSGPGYLGAFPFDDKLDKLSLLFFNDSPL